MSIARPLLACLSALLACAVANSTPAARTAGDDEAVVQAREALRKKDRARFQQLRRQVGGDHPLAMWPDYWDLSGRLAELQQADLDAFYARWRGSYVEDRLRNDWLLELGRRRDWSNFRAEVPHFRMNDDREVSCYAMLTRHLDGDDVRDGARRAWYAQREADDGCQLLASTLYEAKQFGHSEVWHKLRLAIEYNRPRAARAAAALLGLAPAKAVAELLDQPARVLKPRVVSPPPLQRELALLALIRLAASDPDAAGAELENKWEKALVPEQAALAWAAAGKQAALKLSPQAEDFYRRAWKWQRDAGEAPYWSDDMLAWGVRAALRGSGRVRDRFELVARCIEAMSPAEQAEPAWRYWHAKAKLALARPGAAGAADREAAQAQLRLLAGGIDFYGQLAANELGQPMRLPPAPAEPSEAELTAAGALPGLQRGLRLAQIGLRDEGRREWNFTLRGMSDRELIAAAQLACNTADWQICINTSRRTKDEVDVRQRYPMPYAAEITARAVERGLDPAFVFGLIRQETRFMPTLRSHAGASGLMQLMPATARWTARKIGLEFRPQEINEIGINLQLGTTYLKVVLDDFAGSQAMAAAAYNAGPGRPRRWREGTTVDAAAWAESIPIHETRDYVKRVLANAVVYSAMIGGAPATTLRQRLGTTIGPRDAGAPPPDKAIP